MDTNLFVLEGLVLDQIARRQAEAKNWRRLARPLPAGWLRHLLAGFGARLVVTGERLRALEDRDQPACEPC